MFVQYTCTSNNFATYVYKEPWLQGTNLVGSDIYVIYDFLVMMIMVMIRVVAGHTPVFLCRQNF